MRERDDYNYVTVSEKRGNFEHFSDTVTYGNGWGQGLVVLVVVSVKRTPLYLSRDF